MNDMKKEFAPVKKDLITLVNKALAMEYAAIIQYRTHAEAITGPMSEPLVARFKELACDESKHVDTLLDVIGNYLYAEPSTAVAPIIPAKTLDKILDVNVKSEHEAIAIYEKILNHICEHKDDHPHTYHFLEHAIRHILIEEEQHVAELSALMC